MARLVIKRTIPAPPAGLTSELAAGSRQRRQSVRAMTEVQTHAHARRNDLSPLLQIKRLPIDSLTPASRQVRRKQPEQLARIIASLRKFGQCAPILISTDYQIVHGHSVWEAARQLGMTEVSCLIVEHLNQTDRRMLSIALNRLGETGQWDFNAVRLEFQELTILNEDMVVTGFAGAEVDMILMGDHVDTPEAEEDKIPLPGDIATSRTGDVWTLGRHILTQGDARDAESYQRILNPDERARVIFTDVPYNVSVRKITGDDRHREFAMASGEMSNAEFAGFNRDWMAMSARYLIDGGLLSTAIDWRNIDIVMSVGRELKLEPINVIVWSKTNAGQGSLWRSAHEFYPVFKKGTASHVNNVALGKYGRWRSNVWTYPGGSSLGSDSRDGLKLHPTVKPSAMLEDALLDITNRDDIVIDCFCGSGSMVVAAEATGRSCRAIEIDGIYCDVIIRRWELMTGQEAILEATGEPFERVRQIRAATTDIEPAGDE